MAAKIWEMWAGNIKRVHRSERPTQLLELEYELYGHPEVAILVRLGGMFQRTGTTPGRDHY